MGQKPISLSPQPFQLRLQAWRQKNWLGLTLVAGAILAGTAIMPIRFAESLSHAWLAFLLGQHPLLGWHLASPWNALVILAFYPGLLIGLVQLSRRVETWSGGGIPQVLAALAVPPLQGREHFLSLGGAFGKSLLLSLAMGFGLPIGPEGPSIYIGAAVLNSCYRLPLVASASIRAELSLAGAAAGLAVAFTAPLTGLLYSLEMVGYRLAAPEALQLATICATLSSFVAAAWGYPWTFYGPTSSSLLFNGRGVVAVVLVGMVGGSLGGMMATLLIKGSRWIGPSLRRSPLLVAASIGVMVALFGLGTNGLALGSGYDKALAILQQGVLEPWWFALVRVAGNSLCLLSNIPAGLFSPSLTIGAALGQLFHPWIQFLLGEEIPLRPLMILFMSSYLCGVVQTPLAAVTLLLETTGDFSMVPLLLLANVCAQTSGSWWLAHPMYQHEAQAILLQRLPDLETEGMPREC